MLPTEVSWHITSALTDVTLDEDGLFDHPCAFEVAFARPEGP